MKDNNKLILNLAINYSSRQEIISAIKLLYKDIRKKSLPVKELLNYDYQISN